MNTSRFVSKKEHIAICGTAFIIIALAVGLIVVDITYGYNDYVRRTQSELSDKANGRQSIRFSGHSVEQNVAGLHILAVLVFLGLVGAKRFIVPFLLTCLYATFLIYSIYLRYYTDALSGQYFSSPAPFVERFLAVVSAVDLIAMVFIPVMLIWQFSIVWRNYPRILQRR